MERTLNEKVESENAQYSSESTVAIISWKVSDTLNKYENLT